MGNEEGIAAATAPKRLLDSKQLEAILQFDTCTIANAIERFGIRLRNEGFTRPGLNCVTGSDQRILGYAATFQVRSTAPPVIGGKFEDRTDWWSELEQLPHPAIAVFQNLDAEFGAGSCVGNVHAAILKAFGCCGVITDGSIRDVSDIRELGIPAYAASLAVSHSFMHIVDFGTPVEIFGLSIRQGDLLYADCHGVLAIPLEIAAELPDVAARFRRKEKKIVDVCLSADFSPEKLLQAIHENDQCK
jgi:4-hydroxy-4-methyl-2-oxoglutarate aldolase